MNVCPVQLYVCVLNLDLPVAYPPWDDQIHSFGVPKHLPPGRLRDSSSTEEQGVRQAKLFPPPHKHWLCVRTHASEQHATLLGCCGTHYTETMLPLRLGCTPFITPLPQKHTSPLPPKHTSPHIFMSATSVAPGWLLSPTPDCVRVRACV